MTEMTLKEKVSLNSFLTKEMRQLLSNKRIILGGGLFIIIVFIVLLAPYISPYHPLETDVMNRLKSPTINHLFGTDSFGRDVLSRVIWGGRISLFVGAATTIIVGFFGTILGLIAGFFNKADNIIMRIMDGMMAFPGILLALALMAVFGPGKMKVVYACSIVYIPRCTRVVRSRVLSIKNLEYIKAAQCLGSKNTKILLKHIFPNSLNPLIIQLSVTFSRSILSEAGLSFLGVGAPPPVPSWGNMLSEARQVIWVAPWISFFAGFAIFITILSLNILGDGLRDVLDPKKYL